MQRGTAHLHSFVIPGDKMFSNISVMTRSHTEGLTRVWHAKQVEEIAARERQQLESSIM